MGTPPTRDGGVVGKAFTTGTALQFTITTLFNDDIVVVCIGNSLNTLTPATVSSISGGGLTFARRASATITNVAIPSDGTGALEVETWWAHAVNPLTAQTLTVNMNTTVVRAELVASAWNGCFNLSNPWDSNAGLPAVVVTSSTPTSISFSTSQANDELFLFTCNSHNNSSSPPSGYSNLGSSSTTGGGKYPDTIVAVYGQAVMSTQSSVSITDGSNNSVIYIADALTGDQAILPQYASTADTWFGPTSGFVDLTQAANRRKFISEAGCTVNLGGSGSSPFGQTPPVFLSRFTGNPADTFATNLGNGGTFAITGGDLTDAGSLPCCDTTSITSTTAPSLSGDIVGDYRNGNLYAFNMDTLLDNGTQRKWLRTWRALQQPKDTTTRFSSLLIDMETGSTQNPISGNPHLVLRWSDDGGMTWSVPRIVPVGKVGDTIASVRATRLGSTRRFARDDRIFEISSTDAFKVAIVDAEVEVS
jgi:hypothetical protein